jgi:hypothetical protein
MSCDKHLKSVGPYTDMKKLAKDIGDLHYETLEELFIELGVKLSKDADSDAERGRIKLSQSLEKASFRIGMAATNIRKAWHISKPFMEE